MSADLYSGGQRIGCTLPMRNWTSFAATFWNCVNSVRGPDKVTVALVVHGRALMAFHAATAKPELRKRTDEMKKSGLQLNACINTMRAQNVTLKDLLLGFTVAEKGGVVRIAELESQRHVYLRP